MSKQRELQERVSVGDHRLNEINEKIRHYETDEKSNTHRKEFAQVIVNTDSRLNIQF